MSSTHVTIYSCVATYEFQESKLFIIAFSILKIPVSDLQNSSRNLHVHLTKH